MAFVTQTLPPSSNEMCTFQCFLDLYTEETLGLSVLAHHSPDLCHHPPSQKRQAKCFPESQFKHGLKWIYKLQKIHSTRCIGDTLKIHRKFCSHKDNKNQFIPAANGDSPCVHRALLSGASAPR